MSIVQSSINGQKAFEGFAYFFNGEYYYKYDWATDRLVGSYNSISAWNFPGAFAKGLDAGVKGNNGKTYFFRGNQYIRYDWAADAVDPGYPKSLSVWNFPGAFASGIDAAVEGEGAYKGKLYFFKDSQYIRYDLAKDAVDAGYPKPLSAWNLPAKYNTGVDSALAGKGEYAGKVYFFKGGEYVRYDWDLDKADQPSKSIKAWGLPSNVVPGTQKRKGKTDEDGNALLDSGSWNGAARLACKGGQVMHFKLSNANVLGTTITIRSNKAGKKSLILPPFMTMDVTFDYFSDRPINWEFNISTDSDAFIVTWELYSSWIPGD
jgi:hypothetical protein